MTIKIHFIVSLYLLLLAITKVRTELLPKDSVPPSWKDIDKYPLEKSIALIGGFVIIIVITLVLFKRNFIDSTGLIFGLWMLMSFDNVVENSWDIMSLSYLLTSFHITVAFFGLTYWIRLSVREYNKTNTRPSIDLLVEIGAWFFMFILNCTVAAVKHSLRKQQDQVSQWYPVSIAFATIVESYWKRGRKIRANRLKSPLIKNVEDAFHDFVRTCKKEPQSGNIIEFNQKLNDFTRTFCILVAQKREALIINYQ
ncbi:PREDICTED: uncharacterized protein LOC109192927 [Ipomoea nil]|uniref:uncharacterized protein LOC109192927 n=1 Tax=Ipomoea nil TaxID=35883 RepID=UPI0009011A74|nr:PREDICTED: uncharacterized protein LOC109192927 [Ipomoea nil]